MYAPSRSIRRRRSRSVASYSALSLARRAPVRGRFAARSSYLYGSGVPGSMRRVIGSRVGREVPLYLPPSTTLSEAHYFPLVLGALPVTTTGSITFINPVTQGDALNQRHGARIFNTSFILRGNLYSGANTGQSVATLALIYDRQPQGALPAITDIFDSVNSKSMQNVLNRDRFYILWRREWSMEVASVTVATASSSHYVDQTVYVNRPTCFTVGTATGNIADVKTGALYFVTMGTNAAGSGFPEFDGNCRVVFSP